MANTRAFVLASKGPSIKELFLRVHFVLSGVELHKLHSSVEIGIRNSQSNRHILLDPVYSRQHPPNRALEDSRERR